jgi:hypothetical protein
MHTNIFCLAFLQVYDQRIHIHYAFDDQTPSGIEEALDRSARNPHSMPRLVLVEILDIAQAHRLELIERQFR